MKKIEMENNVAATISTFLPASLRKELFNGGSITIFRDNLHRVCLNVELFRQPTQDNTIEKIMLDFSEIEDVEDIFKFFGNYYMNNRKIRPK